MTWNRAKCSKHGWASFTLAFMLTVFGAGYRWLALPFFIAAAALPVVALVRD